MKKAKDKKSTSSTWLEINLAALALNYRLLKSIVGEKKKIMAVVKSDAYGHGLISVSRKLSGLGVEYLAVSSLDEALSLRKAGIKGPILLLNALLDSELDYLFKYDISLTLVDLRQAKALSTKAKNLNKKVKVHIEVDTGMGRTGLCYANAKQAIKKILILPYLDIEGIFTHFACADCNTSFTYKQIADFRNLLNLLKSEGITFKLTHAQNSAGILNFPGLEFNMVRPGLMLYGLSPDRKVRQKLPLRPVMSLKTRIAFLKTVSKGQSISYGRTYIAASRRLIATVSVGYADGYNRLLSNSGEVLVRGKRAKVIGRVCMDNTMIDVSSIHGVRLGDEVVLFGRQAKLKILVEELADICKTIAYEIVCGIPEHVRRQYL